jgi:hypothetical protein
MFDEKVVTFCDIFMLNLIKLRFLGGGTFPGPLSPPPLPTR